MCQAPQTSDKGPTWRPYFESETSMQERPQRVQIPCYAGFCRVETMSVKAFGFEIQLLDNKVSGPVGMFTFTLHVYVCVYIYICIDMRVSVSTYIYICTYIHIHVCIYSSKVGPRCQQVWNWLCRVQRLSTCLFPILKPFQGPK